MSGLGLNAIARAHLLRHKGKSALIVVGLATAVAAFVAVMSLVLSLQATLDVRLAKYGASLIAVPEDPELSLQYGGITVAAAGSARARLLDPGVVKAIEGIQSRALLAAVLPVVLRPVTISGDERRYTQQLLQYPPESVGRMMTPRYLAIGTDARAAAAVKPWWQVEGTLPTQPHEVLLGLNARNRLRAEVGTSLVINGQAFVVTGILRETGGEEDNAVIMDPVSLALATQTSPQPNMVEIAVTDTAVVEPVAQEIQAAAPGVEVRSVKQSLEFATRTISSLAEIGLGATILIVLIATLIVVLTMIASVRERQREIGVFRAVGFRTRDVVSLLFRESLLLSTPAAVTGVALGLVAAAYSPKLVSGLDLDLALSGLVLAGGPALGVVLATLATIYPALLATRLDPAIALRRL